MFTGLIEEIGEIVRVEDRAEGKRIRVRAPLVCADLRPGDSVSVNGVCQTVTALPAPGCFEVTAVEETLRRTTFRALRAGGRANLERPLRAGDRLGGHWVNGHVDAVGSILEQRRSGGEVACRISLPAGLAPYVVEKGSIAVDGVSLTVGPVQERSFTVYIIPETLRRTLFADYRPGDRVNLEADVLAKYVERILAGRRRGEAARDQKGWKSAEARRVFEGWMEEGRYGSQDSPA